MAGNDGGRQGVDALTNPLHSHALVTKFTVLVEYASMLAFVGYHMAQRAAKVYSWLSSAEPGFPFVTHNNVYIKFHVCTKFIGSKSMTLNSQTHHRKVHSMVVGERRKPLEHAFKLIHSALKTKVLLDQHSYSVSVAENEHLTLVRGNLSQKINCGCQMLE